MTSLWQLPLWVPQLPVWARLSKSGCSAPSCIARSASSLIMAADSMPCAHNPKSLLANLDCGPPAFSKACFFAFPKAGTGTLPDSISICHPLSLLHILGLSQGYQTLATEPKTAAGEMHSNMLQQSATLTHVARGGMGVVWGLHMQALKLLFFHSSIAIVQAPLT